MTITGAGIAFGHLAAGGDVGLTSASGIDASGFTAGGTATVDVVDTTAFTAIEAARFVGRSQGGLSIERLVASEARFAADTVDVGVLRQAAGATTPLVVSLGGRDGDLATRVALQIDADDVRMPQLHAVDATIVTTAGSVRIADALIGRVFGLMTPVTTVLVDNVTFMPRSGFDVQLSAPRRSFYLDQIGELTRTDAFVVSHAAGARVQGAFGSGGGLIDDVDRLGRIGNTMPVFDWQDVSPLATGVERLEVFDRRLDIVRIDSASRDPSGLAVNVGSVDDEKDDEDQR